jgi:hypothetical protein
MAEPRGKGKRADWLNGSINLYSNSRRREKRTGKERRGRGRNIRRRLNGKGRNIRRRLTGKGKRARRRWTSFYSGFLGRQQIDGSKTAQIRLSVLPREGLLS